MTKLPENFELDRYGLHVRLVREEDAEFIVRLRTDEKLSKYIHPTENNIQKQIDYIKGYKEREARGEDYYFIFLYQNQSVGVARLYNITEQCFTFGSWLFVPDIPFWVSAAGALITREIGFEMLDKELEKEVDGTHEDNKGVISFSKMLGMNFDSYRIDAKGKYLTGALKKEDFEKNKLKITRIIPQ